MKTLDIIIKFLILAVLSFWIGYFISSKNVYMLIVTCMITILYFMSCTYTMIMEKINEITTTK